MPRVSPRRLLILATAGVCILVAFLPQSSGGFSATTASLANSWTAAAAASSNTPLTSLALDASTPAVVSTGLKTVTTASFTPPSGSLLMVNAAMNFGAGFTATAITVTNSGTALTWTQVAWIDSAHSSGTEGGEYVAWATLPTSRALTVTFTVTTSTSMDGVLLDVRVITGANTTSPIGAKTVVPDTSGTFAPSLVTTVANSWVWLDADDWAAGPLPTAGPNSIIASATSYGNVNATATSSVWRADTTTPTVGTTVTISNTAPTSPNWNLILYEIKPATGANVAGRFVAAGAAVTGTTSLSVAYPAGVATNDVLVLVVNHKGTTAPTTPAGWTALFTQSYPASASSLAAVYYRVHPSGGATTAVAVSPLTDSSAGFMLAFRGIDTTTPIAAAPGGWASSVNAAGTSGTTGKAVTPVLGDVVLAIEGYAASGSLTYGNLTPDATGLATGQSASSASGTTSSVFAGYQTYLRSGGTGTLAGFTADHSVATDPANAAALIVLRHGPPV